MNKVFKLLILIILGIFLFLAGLGRELYLVRIIGLVVSGLLTILAWIKNQKVKLPKWWWIYGLFLISLIIGQKWSWNRFASLHYFYLFLSGGMFWVGSYNLKKELKENFDKVILGLGLGFGALFIYSYYFTNPKLGSQSLYLPYTDASYHNNIGDLWGMVGVVALFYLLKNSKKVLNWLLVGLGGYLLYMSRSRAGFISLGMGGWWLMDKLKKVKKEVKTILLVFVIGLILITAQYKPLLTSRQYYFQTIMGLLEYPKGIGIGSFEAISRNPDFHIWGMNHFSSVVHNLVLEIVSGIGWLGLIFVVWLIMVGKNVLKKGKSGFLYKAVWLSLTINFMFHSCYRIPAMYWMWMIVLGLG